MSPFDDEFFGNDPFEDIVREFFGKPNRTNRVIRGEEEDRNIDFIEDENYVYLVFELPGYEEKDIDIQITGKTIEINAIKKESSCENENVQSYLTQKLCRGVKIKKTLPNFINTKKFKSTMKNGILEIMFSKK